MGTSNLRLFAEAVHDAQPPLALVPRGAVDRAPQTVAPSASRSQTVALETQIIAAFDRPAELGQTATDAFRCKEHDIAQLFAALSVADARTLQRRLTNPTSDDPIATRFNRFVVERRARLLAWLQDARRRAVIAGCR